MVRIKIAKQALKIRGFKPRWIAGAKFRYYPINQEKHKNRLLGPALVQTVERGMLRRKGRTIKKRIVDKR